MNAQQYHRFPHDFDRAIHTAVDWQRPSPSVASSTLDGAGDIFARSVVPAAKRIIECSRVVIDRAHQTVPLQVGPGSGGGAGIAPGDFLFFNAGHSSFVRMHYIGALRRRLLDAMRSGIINMEVDRAGSLPHAWFTGCCGCCNLFRCRCSSASYVLIVLQFSAIVMDAFALVQANVYVLQLQKRNRMQSASVSHWFAVL